MEWWNIPWLITLSLFLLESFSSTLKFVVKDCDPTTGEPDPEGYDDEYEVENVELSISDYIRPNYVSQFTQEWDSLENELVETFALDKEKAPSLKGKAKGSSDEKRGIVRNWCFFVYPLHKRNTHSCNSGVRLSSWSTWYAGIGR